MKVLKFGGTSVANSNSIANVMSIVQKEEQCTVVVSALGGVTDLLLQAMEQAAQNDETYRTVFPLLEERHLEIIKGFIPAKSQSSLISFVKVQLNRLETLLEGVAMLQEITPKAADKVASFGEHLSSNIIAAVFRENNIDVRLFDGRDLIETNVQNNRQIIHLSLIHI